MKSTKVWTHHRHGVAHHISWILLLSGSLLAGTLGIMPAAFGAAITMSSHQTRRLRGAVRLFGILAAILGQSFFAQAVLADIVQDQNFVQSARQSAANAASLPEFNPFGTMAAVSISPFVGTTNAVGGNANSSNASVSVVQLPGGSNPNATAKALADLASGNLGAYAQAYGPATTSAASEAGFWDTLTFSGPSGSALAQLALTVSGAFFSTGQGSACLLVGGGLCNPLFLTPTTSWPTLDSTNPSELLTTTPFTISNGSSIEFSAGIYAQADNPTSSTVILPTADLYDPPHVSLDLPSGWSLASSASGVFTGNPAPVPLPGTVWFFGSGLVGLLWTARRQCQNAN
ncbi:MAG: hypothetical protein ACYC9J_02350 [Sulfuricaulis sp.]